MRAGRVKALLMGGQACVFYGAAEFSRDTDLAIVAAPANLDKLKQALKDLQAEVIAVPTFNIAYLNRGHAIHFRCRHPEALRMRVDIMSRMRGVDPFSKLWKRRTTIQLSDGTKCDLLSLPDLVKAKKTQRDKDWPMIRRLVECHYFANIEKPTAAQIRFWLLELRTAELLVELAKSHSRVCQFLKKRRPLLAYAATGNFKKIEKGLLEEELKERAKDRRYWLPLFAELEKLRHKTWRN